MLAQAAKSFTEDAHATNADDTDSCRLLECPALPLSLIWHHACKLPMHDRCALLATCKRALSTLGGLTDRMERLQLTLGERPEPDSSTAHVQHGGYSGNALKVLSWFPGTRIGKLEMRFAAGRMGAAGSRPITPFLRSFATGAQAWLMHVTSLKLCDSKVMVSRKCNHIPCTSLHLHVPYGYLSVV